MIQVYISSHDRDGAEALAAILEAEGDIEVVSTWHDAPMGRTADKTVEERVAIAQRNYEQIARAQVLVFQSGPDRYPGGKAVEAGIALGEGLEIVVVGRRENIMLWHPNVHAVEEPIEEGSIAHAVRLAAGRA